MNFNYRKYLTDEILPFWLNHAMDHENGGIYTMLDRKGEVYCTDKNVWFQGRAMWTFSVAYNTIEKRREYLDACEEIYRFLPKCTSPSGRMPFIVEANGTTKIARDYYYSEAFAAIGCAQYYKACGRREVWEKADSYFDVLYGLYSDSAARNSAALGEDNPFKVFGLHMIMLSTAQFMRNVGINRGKYDKLAVEAINEMKNGGYIRDDLHGVVENVLFDGSLTNSEEQGAVYPGHAYEAAWFVMLEGEIKNDDTLRSLGRKMLDYAMPEAFEKTVGFIPNERNAAETQTYGKTKKPVYVWWTQCEAVIAYYLAYNIFGEEKYKKISEKLLNLSFEHYADREFGEWYPYLNTNGTVAEPIKGDKSKGPFHLPRMLMALISVKETGNILKYIS